jgi:hypothetical protein
LIKALEAEDLEENKRLERKGKKEKKKGAQNIIDEAEEESSEDEIRETEVFDDGTINIPISLDLSLIFRIYG